MAPIPGARLGAYDVTALTGMGGLSEVRGATDTRRDREVS